MTWQVTNGKHQKLVGKLHSKKWSVNMADSATPDHSFGAMIGIKSDEI